MKHRQTIFVRVQLDIECDHEIDVENLDDFVCNDLVTNFYSESEKGFEVADQCILDYQ